MFSRYWESLCSDLLSSESIFFLIHVTCILKLLISTYIHHFLTQQDGILMHLLFGNECYLICRYGERFSHNAWFGHTFCITWWVRFLLNTIDSEFLWFSFFKFTCHLGFINRTIRLWAVTGEVLLEMVGHTAIVYAVDAHKYGLVVSGSEDGSAKIWKGNEYIYILSFPLLSLNCFGV